MLNQLVIGGVVHADLAAEFENLIPMVCIEQHPFFMFFWPFLEKCSYAVTYANGTADVD